MDDEGSPDEDMKIEAIDLGPTLLERFMGEALTIAIDASTHSQRMRGHLPPIATRALFQATRGMKDLELLAVLKPNIFDLKADQDTTAARHLRSVGRERRQSLHTLQMQAVALMSSPKVPKADIARGWALMLIFDAAGQAVREARKLHGSLDMTALQANPTWPNEMLCACFELVNKHLADGFERATKDVERSFGVTQDTALKTRFLYYSASEIIQSMDRPVLLIAAYEDLLSVVYPAIEAAYKDDEIG